MSPQLLQKTQNRDGGEPSPRNRPDHPVPPEPTTGSGTESPLRSIHTTSFPQILAQLHASVLVTTYQAGKLVLLRNDEGVLNTHFRLFGKPMGLAVRGGKLAIGTTASIQEFHSMPAVAPKIEPAGKHDVAWLPRRENVTGDVQIHEMAWVEDELWFGNTAFSCLAVRSNHYSFEPRWRPPFVSQLAPGDRCHLNGLAVVDGRVRYVTALGETDTPGGWRANKRDGGVLIDVDSGEIVARGLSMPHSPRWYDGKLWILNSGSGGFGTIDLSSGRYEEIAQFPGFTRGLSFLGPLAFIGLSQVRESAVFSGIPLVDRVEERTCGVWVLDVRTGETVAFVKFEEAVQEIFAVEVLPGMRFPDLVNDNADLISSSYVLPEDALAEVPGELRSGPRA
jgi:uncharacterized protein (TIGR03032 family)